ncbi:MAG: hypothetical protein LBE34_00670 [Flavobacteriaceae bacterium]|jgi:hypothetical protein|nr:hypothetical protein [Flavobacteriaceae bacterium]
MRKTSLLLLGVVLFAVGCNTDSNEEQINKTKQVSSFENNINSNVYAGINVLHSLYLERQGENVDNQELSQVISGVEDAALNTNFTHQYNFNKETYKYLNSEIMQRIVTRDLNVLREVNYSEYIIDEVQRVLETDTALDVEGLRYRIGRSTDISEKEKDFLLNSLDAGHPPTGIDDEWRKSNIVALLYYAKESKLNVATATTVLKVVLN